MLHDLLGSI